MTMSSATPKSIDPATLDLLETIQRRVLWLATNIVHHANNVRPNPDGTKVGGHQASSASVVTIMTALYFHFLQEGDRVSIKPHASPVYHAIQYLLGQLPAEYLTQLRAYGGLQAYPSRTKDPDPVDFSTGSVGLGAVAPAFAALTQKYAQSHFGSVTSRRFVALVGDAELDEGNVWEAVLDEALDGLDNLIWIVDLNRQSLDRVVPGIRAARLKHLFEAMGWRVLEAKYGRHLQEIFARPGGDALRQLIDEMDNEEYQAFLRLPGAELRDALIAKSAELATLLADQPDETLPTLLANLGGHDLGELITVLDEAATPPATGKPRPTIIFAYTVKGWGLPLAGHPLNHSMLLTEQQMATVRTTLGIATGEEWASFAADSAAGQRCAAARARLYPATPAPAPVAPVTIPTAIGLTMRDRASTQDAFGRLLFRLADQPEVAARLVTCSPDVSFSTNLAGWINKTGSFKMQSQPDYTSEGQRLLKWQRGPEGQHIELGISEMNLFLLLGMFGLSNELNGQMVAPIGTVYDPFVCRGLDALIYALYSGAKFVFAGTPSGITLAPEGGAHQSTITPSIGTELPNLRMYEPCFGREVEWTLLDGIRSCFDREHGQATYLRLSTKPIDQQLMASALARLGEETLREQVLAGGYRLLDWRQGGSDIEPGTVVHIAATGAMIPEACAAAIYLWREGVAVNVLNLTSPRRLFETWRATPFDQRASLFSWLIAPEERHAPIITVQDGASHSLAWLGSAFGAPVVPLGVDHFGQSGTQGDLYQHFGIDWEAIAAAALSTL